MKKPGFYLIGLALLAISFFLDDAVSSFFVSRRAVFLDTLSLFINGTEGYVLFLFVLIVLLLFEQKKRILPLLLTLVLYFFLAGFIKVIAARPRPFAKLDFGDNFPYLDDADINRSFPSGHSTASASLIRFFEFNNILLWAWTGITFFIMFSRVYLGMHYLSDVIGGFVLGYAISDFSIFVAEKFKISKK